MSKKEAEDCVELKNIKYKTMLMSGNDIQDNVFSNDLNNLDKFLESEKNMSRNEPWGKLDKTIRTRKMIEFADMYAEEQGLQKEEKEQMVAFLKDCLNKKRLYRVKDVNYNKEEGVIKEIPALVYNKQTRHFTLKKTEKHVTTLKSASQKKSKSPRAISITKSKEKSRAMNKSRPSQSVTEETETTT